MNYANPYRHQCGAFTENFAPGKVLPTLGRIKISAGMNVSLLFQLKTRGVLVLFGTLVKIILFLMGVKNFVRCASSPFPPGSNRQH